MRKDNIKLSKFFFFLSQAHIYFFISISIYSVYKEAIDMLTCLGTGAVLTETKQQKTG